MKISMNTAINSIDTMRTTETRETSRTTRANVRGRTTEVRKRATYVRRRTTEVWESGRTPRERRAECERDIWRDYCSAEHRARGQG